MTICRTLFLMLVCLGFIHSVNAQSPDSSLLGALRFAYQQLDYDRSEVLAKSILATYDAYSVDELTEAHTTLAFVHFARNKQLEARRQFEAALSLQGDLELDPVYVSPKILAFFEEVRSDVQRVDDDEDPVVIVRYVKQTDVRPAAAWRSLALPGLGQVYKAEVRKGRVLIGLWAGTLAATGTAHFIRRDARHAYREAREPTVIANRYDRYNSWHKVRNGLALATAGIWLYSYLDALIKPTALPATAASKAQLTVAPGPGAPSLAFTYSF